MAHMMGDKRARNECPWGCCSDSKAQGKRGANRWHRMFRTREKREWRKEQWS